MLKVNDNGTKIRFSGIVVVIFLLPLNILGPVIQFLILTEYRCPPARNKLFQNCYRTNACHQKSPEVFYKRSCSSKFRKFHRKTLVLEPLYKDIANLRTAASKAPSLLSINTVWPNTIYFKNSVISFPFLPIENEE